MRPGIVVERLPIQLIWRSSQRHPYQLTAGLTRRCYRQNRTSFRLQKYQPELFRAATLATPASPCIVRILNKRRRVRSGIQCFGPQFHPQFLSRPCAAAIQHLLSRRRGDVWSTSPNARTVPDCLTGRSDDRRPAIQHRNGSSQIFDMFRCPRTFRPSPFGLFKRRLEAT